MATIKRDKSTGLLLLVAALTFLLLPQHASATLFDLEGSYFYDDSTGLVWYEDLAALNHETPQPRGADNDDWGLITETYINDDAFADTLEWRVADWLELENFFENSPDEVELPGGLTRTTEFDLTEGPIVGILGFEREVVLSTDPYWGVYQYMGYIMGSEFDFNFHRDLTHLFGIDGYSEEAFDPIYQTMNFDYAVVADVTFGGPQVPVPEPATMFLFGTGLIGLAGVRRKRTKK